MSQGQADRRIKVVIVDDHLLMRNLIREILLRDGKIEVVGTVEDPKAVLPLVKQTRPDVLVVDYAMPAMSGLELIRLLQDHALGLPVLVVSVHNDSHLLMKLREVGAQGYMEKNQMMCHLVPAIRRLEQGGTYFLESL